MTYYEAKRLRRNKSHISYAGVISPFLWMEQFKGDWYIVHGDSPRSARRALMVSCHVAEITDGTYRLLNAKGERYMSIHKASEVGTAHCPDCLLHYEDCRCYSHGRAGKSNRKPDLDRYDS